MNEFNEQVLGVARAAIRNGDPVPVDVALQLQGAGYYLEDLVDELEDGFDVDSYLDEQEDSYE